MKIKMILPSSDRLPFSIPTCQPHHSCRPASTRRAAAHLPELERRARNTRQEVLE
uniref:Uncharacterized protein n=1 Tax=Arundo donax TaxID=35708 RepID=A0A0A8YJ72_ARUDO